MLGVLLRAGFLDERKYRTQLEPCCFVVLGLYC